MISQLLNELLRDDAEKRIVEYISKHYCPDSVYDEVVLADWARENLPLKELITTSSDVKWICRGCPDNRPCQLLVDPEDGAPSGCAFGLVSSTAKWQRVEGGEDE